LVRDTPLRRALRAVALGAIGVVMALSPALGKSLRIGGTGATNGLLAQLAPAFTAETGITLEVVAGLGTSGANNALADGKLDISFAGRELRDKERARGLKVVGTVRTPIGLVTSREGPDDLKSTEIAALLRADRPVWPDGTPILIILRPADETDYIVLGEHFPGFTEALQHLRRRRDLSIAATDQDNLDMAEKLRGSLTSATLTQMMTEKRNLRFVAITGVAASLENHQNGSYPYGKRLYLVVPSAMSPEAAAFIAFLAGPAGEALLRRGGLIAGK
jgi:phosphate transport system substrate-binding protein